jgi:hypothetical protein
MRIPARFAPTLFSALLSAIMVALISAFALVMNQGLTSDFLATWLRNCMVTWLVAFPTVAVVAPLVRRIVARVTVSAPATNR